MLYTGVYLYRMLYTIAYHMYNTSFTYWSRTMSRIDYYGM